MNNRRNSYIEAAAAIIPYGIICRHSAAQLHEMSTVNPLAVSIAIPANRTRVVIPDYPPVELVPPSMVTFELGLVSIKAGHTFVYVYDQERTVCDFFRKRNTLLGQIFRKKWSLNTAICIRFGPVFYRFTVVFSFLFVDSRAISSTAWVIFRPLQSSFSSQVY